MNRINGEYDIEEYDDDSSAAISRDGAFYIDIVGRDVEERREERARVVGAANNFSPMLGSLKGSKAMIDQIIAKERNFGNPDHYGLLNLLRILSQELEKAITNAEAEPEVKKLGSSLTRGARHG